MASKLLSVALLPIWLAAPAPAPPAVSLTPAPSDLLHGLTLTVPEWNLSLEAPGPEWEWFVAPDEAGRGPNRHRTFVCQLPGTSTQFIVAAFDPFWAAMTPTSASEVMAGVAASLRETGWNTTEVGPDPVNIPLPGSFRFRVDGTNAEGAHAHYWGYVAAADRMFLFRHTSTHTEESPAFRSFVASFRMIGELPRPLEGVSALHTPVAVALTVLLGAVGWVVNRVAGRVVINIWKAVILILLVSAIALSVFWGRLLPEALSPFRQGEAIGYSVVGPLLFPAIFALWRLRVVERHRRAERGRG